MLYKQRIYLVICVALLMACKKKPTSPCLPSDNPLTGTWLVLNEGLFQHNNSSISQVTSSTETANNQFFDNQAGRPLGDTGNDMKKYGGKIYVVVNVSSTLEILDASTGKSLKQISMLDNGQAKQPRFIDFKDDKAFISCFDGYVDVLDTASLSIVQRIKVGSNPDHLRVVGNKLYVSNSGGLNFPNVDSTVSVISLQSLTEIKKITVGANPGTLAKGGNGSVFVVSRGNLGSIQAHLHRIDPELDEKVEDYSFSVRHLAEKNGDLMLVEEGNPLAVRVFDVVNNQLHSSVFLSLAGIQTVYKLQFDTVTQNVLVLNANGYVNSGYVHQFNGNGAFVRKVKVGLVPSAVLIF